ncbi:MAG: hypothetical protein GWN86_01575, partial [Desulfobacterales bacterium]|nr:hypothetical protein [Desulfobacterales bacterium]
MLQLGLGDEAESIILWIIGKTAILDEEFPVKGHLFIDDRFELKGELILDPIVLGIVGEFSLFMPEIVGQNR